MSRATQKAFERVDKNDPTLAVDGLSDFSPPQIALEIDPTLSTLGDLFPEREADEDENEDEIGEYFSGAHEAAGTAAPSEEPAESERIFGSDEVVQSDIQRAAMEFQRFAEKFHAFATECQQRSRSLP